MKRLNAFRRPSLILLAATALLTSAGVGTAITAHAADNRAAASLVAAADPTGTTERLDRGLISMRTTGGNFLSWRLLKSDPAGTAFNVYRDGLQVTATPVTAGTNFTDADNTWGNNTLSDRATVAADAHFGVSTTFDFYKNTFNRNGIFNDWNPSVRCP